MHHVSVVFTSFFVQVAIFFNSCPKLGLVLGNFRWLFFGLMLFMSPSEPLQNEQKQTFVVFGIFWCSSAVSSDYFVFARLLTMDTECRM